MKIKATLFRDAFGEYFIRIKDNNRAEGYMDCDIYCDEISIVIDDPFIEIKKSENNIDYIDYNNKVLGK